MKLRCAALRVQIAFILCLHSNYEAGRSLSDHKVQVEFIYVVTNLPNSEITLTRSIKFTHICSSQQRLHAPIIVGPDIHT